MRGTRIKVTTFTKELITEEHSEVAVKQLLAFMSSPDPKVSLPAIKLFLDKFFVSAEKQTEAEAIRSNIENKAEYDRLLKELKGQ